MAGFQVITEAQGAVLRQRFGIYKSGDGSVGLSERSAHRLLAAG